MPEKVLPQDELALEVSPGAAATPSTYLHTI
jgi:hypothetical protein